LTDIAGAIVELYAFDAYGNAIGFDPSVALTEFLYSGEQFDSKISQQYLRQRYYNPATGRFNRLDLFFGNLNDPQSFHKYLYTHADPINGIDPNGLNAAAIGGVLQRFYGGLNGLNAVRISYNAAVVATGAVVIGNLFVLGASYNLSLSHLIENLFVSATVTGATAVYVSMLDNLPGIVKAIDDAVKIAYKAAKEAIKKIIENLPPMYFVPELFTPVIYDNTVTWLTENPILYVLSYQPCRDTATANRREVTKGLGPAKIGYQWDEYLYASTNESNPIVSKTAQVPQRENSMQGGYLRGFYTRNFPGRKPREKTGYYFLVIPVPALPSERPDTTPNNN
jgi:RHS repeat-associated protein